MSATVVSVNVGLPRSMGSEDADDPVDRPWHSGIFKSPVEGPVHAGPLGLSGDGQADLQVHGGPDKAILAYAASHYPLWRSEWNCDDVPYGGFGENLTIDGLDEHIVCIGDVFAVGTVRMEVSQPRQPCWKLGRRWRRKNLPDDVIRTCRCGWYLRVLTPGELTSGQAVELLQRPNPDWSVARASHVMHFQKHDHEAMRALAALPALSASWRATFNKRLSNAAVS